jgi:hypothetical protein
MYNIVLGIRGKQKSHELMGKNERKKYKIQSKSFCLFNKKEKNFLKHF